MPQSKPTYHPDLSDGNHLNLVLSYPLISLAKTGVKLRIFKLNLTLDLNTHSIQYAAKDPCAL